MHNISQIRREASTARFRVLVAVVAGLISGGVTAGAAGWHLAPLVAWDTAAIAYGLWTWFVVGGMDADQTASHALREDPTRAAADALLLAASVASLVAVGNVIIHASSAGSSAALQTGLGVASVVLSWAVVHTVFMLRYARMYYGDNPGGVGFNGEGRPRYADFAYLAFTIGMTFQVSDTTLETKEFRSTALKHALLSYMFGTGIVATTINLIAGLGR